MLGQGIHNESIISKDPWFGGPIEDLRDRVSADAVHAIDQYQREQIPSIMTLIDKPLPLDFQDTERQATRDITRNTIRHSKGQRDTINKDPVIAALQKARREGTNTSMTQEAMRARRTILLLQIAHRAIADVMQPPDDPDTSISIQRL